MKFILVIDHDNKIVSYINTDAENTEDSSDRDLAGFECIDKETELSWTFWRNRNVSEKNPYPFNRVNVHRNYGTGKNDSYYCVSEVHEIKNGETEITDR